MIDIYLKFEKKFIWYLIACKAELQSHDMLNLCLS